MPRTKKPAGRAVDRRNGRQLELAHTAIERPAMPRGLCVEAKRQWEAYWSDPVSSAPTAADRGLLVRWIENVDRYLRMTAEADRRPLVPGSTGQMVVNPCYKIAEQALAALERCERQLGIGAKHRADLGLAIIAEQKSLADMNARYVEEPEPDDSDDDPRLAVVADD